MMCIFGELGELGGRCISGFWCGDPFKPIRMGKEVVISFVR